VVLAVLALVVVVLVLVARRGGSSGPSEADRCELVAHANNTAIDRFASVRVNGLQDPSGPALIRRSPMFLAWPTGPHFRQIGFLSCFDRFSILEVMKTHEL